MCCLECFEKTQRWRADDGGQSENRRVCLTVSWAIHTLGGFLILFTFGLPEVFHDERNVKAGLERERRVRGEGRLGTNAAPSLMQASWGELRKGGPL